MKNDKQKKAFAKFIGGYGFALNDQEYELVKEAWKEAWQAAQAEQAEQEPVAWMSSSGSVVGKEYKIRRTKDEGSDNWWTHFKDYTIPLYTH